MMSSPDRLAAETWFLRRGLPSVLTGRARWRRLWQRSAPALAALAVVFLAGPVITLVNGGEHINIDGDPAAVEWVVIVLLLLTLPAMLVAAMLVSRIADDRRRLIAAFTAVGLCLVADVVTNRPAQIPLELLSTVVMIGLVLTVNGLGIGAVIGWESG